jgi:RNA polymerase sigma-70 factor (ECF subfamily)
MPLSERDRIWRFEQIALPHLDAAYNLARRLTRNDHDAEDVVQESCLRALKYVDGFRGGDGRAWLLTIVRHTCYSWLQVNHPKEVIGGFDETRIDEDEDNAVGELPENDPQTWLLRSVEVQMVDTAIAELPPEFREVLVLRELEDLSYKEIARVAGIPLGTVMSRLARARKLLQRALLRRQAQESLR